MGTGSKETFFQGEDTRGQKTHTKKFNITNYQGNENQNYNEISPHICQNGYYQKDKK